MKRILILLCLPLLFNSCQTTSNPSPLASTPVPLTNTNIVGLWTSDVQYYLDEYNLYTSPNGQVDTIYDDLEGEWEYQHINIEFTSTIFYWGSISSPWHISGNSIIVDNYFPMQFRVDALYADSAVLFLNSGDTTYQHPTFPGTITHGAGRKYFCFK